MFADDGQWDTGHTRRTNRMSDYTGQCGSLGPTRDLPTLLHGSCTCIGRAEPGLDSRLRTK